MKKNRPFSLYLIVISLSITSCNKVENNHDCAAKAIRAIDLYNQIELKAPKSIEDELVQEFAILTDRRQFFIGEIAYDLDSQDPTFKDNCLKKIHVLSAEGKVNLPRNFKNDQCAHLLEDYNFRARTNVTIGN